ncbi:MAG TPA: VIT domain-containing protein, partial [Ottowia sp.]|nr:VIT domain-containing protein [Ottowia sp.]
MLSAIDPLAVVRSAPQAALRGVLPVALPRPWRVPVQRGALAAQRLAWLGALGALLLLAPPVQAQDGQAAPLKAESPYFFVQGAQPGVEALPLKRTDVHAHVSGVIADVVVIQHYRNEGQVPIEARYIFPGGTHAAVNGMVVRVGNRRVVAQIREKQAARIEYDAARREGKTAALLEQHRPNVFQMQVANILPGDEVDVELRYNELLVPTDGQYQFVFPTVVGPRYAPPRSAASHAAQPPEGALA